MSKHPSLKDTLTRLKELDEQELVSLTQKQLPYVTAAYEELMRRYQSQLHSIALRYLANHADAEEVVHEVMLKVFIHLKKFENRSSFKTWVYRLTYNESVDKIRSVTKHATGEDQDLESIPAEQKDHLQASELKSLDHWLKTLSALDRSIVVFRVQFELDFKEIAEIVDLKLSTVKMKHICALEKLKNHSYADKL